MAVLKPRTMAEAEAAIQEAAQVRQSLEIIGTGSKRMIGQPSEANDVLDLSEIAGIVAYEPEELVLTAQGGTRMTDIAESLAARGQMLAFEPPDFSQLLGTGAGSIGGALASNFSGPRRIKAGAARDFMLGFKGVNGRGEKFQAGGRVVKNVTGYDLPRLMCGSWGTLAVMGEVTVKVMPLPETQLSVGISGATHAEGLKAMTMALQSSAEISGAAYVPAPLTGDTRSQTMLRIEGIDASVRARAEVLKGLLNASGALFELDEAGSRNFWLPIRDAVPLASPGEDHIWRLSVPPSESARVAAEISAGTEARYYCDWAGGLIWLAVPPAPDAQAAVIRQAIGNGGGHATLIRAPAEVRGSVAVFQPQPQALEELTRRVKLSFDPLRLLNRGRMFEGI